MRNSRPVYHELCLLQTDLARQAGRPSGVGIISLLYQDLNAVGDIESTIHGIVRARGFKFLNLSCSFVLEMHV